MRDSTRGDRAAADEQDVVPQPSGLGELLAGLDALAATRERLTVDEMITVVGQRSFGPLLLLAGLIVTSPLSGIPGVPTVTALTVLLVAGQLLAGRHHLWLPQWLLTFSLPAAQARPAFRRLQRPAAWVDRLIRPRLTALTAGTGNRFLAGVCILVAVSMPPLELFPFAATTAGVLITLLSLAIIANDGLLALIALVLAGLILGMVAVLAAWL